MSEQTDPSVPAPQEQIAKLIDHFRVELVNCRTSEEEEQHVEELQIALVELLAAPSVPAVEARQLAARIADRLFTNGLEEHAQRLVLTVDRPVGRDLGGWCEQAVIDQIEKILMEAAIPSPQTHEDHNTKKS